MLKDPAACVFVPGAARRVEVRLDVKLKELKLLGLSLGRITPLCSRANI